MVIRTQNTTIPEVIERWGPSPDDSQGVGRPDALVPFLTSQTHVDLVVFGLGGDYREYNIPINSALDMAPGTWAWPVVLR